MRLSKSLIKADIIAAHQAIEYFDHNGVKDIKNVAAYHLQQATEKLIKYQIYQNLNNASNHSMYTHDLSRLIGYAVSEGLELNIPDYIYDHMNSITAWEAGSRYDIGFSIRIDTLKKCYNVIEQWEKQI